MLAHNEATITNNVKVITPAGYTHLVTVRQGATEADIKAHLETIRRLDAAFEKMAWQPAEGKRQPRRNEGPPANGHRSPPPAISNGHGPQTSSNGNGNRFPCQSLACTIDGGKQYWKISDAGGRWKYPVMIYPEILKQYFDLDSLDPGTVYSLTDWEATYTENDKGYPRKVVGLHPPGDVEPQAPVTPAPQPVQRNQMPPEATMLQHGDPPRYNALMAAQGPEDEIPF